VTVYTVWTVLRYFLCAGMVSSLYTRTNESSDSIICREFQDCLANYWLLSRDYVTLC